MKKTYSITLFRHGQSAYVQGNAIQTVESADDLAAKAKPPPDYTPHPYLRSLAIKEVKISAEKLAAELDNTIPVTILSSPVGRTLHTAKVIMEVLVKRGFGVNAIQPDKALREVDNFSWELFEPLMNGGELMIGGGLMRAPFKLKKSETNPFNHGYPQYFMDDDAHRIPEEVKASWPKTYRDQVAGFEKFNDVTNRFLSRITDAGTQIDGHFILVAHDCATMYLADKYTNGRQKGLIPGTFISIDRRESDGRLVVTRVGDITDGDNETDFIAQWFNRTEPWYLRAWVEAVG